jgi:hypothetical protein
VLCARSAVLCGTNITIDSTSASKAFLTCLNPLQSKHLLFYPHLPRQGIRSLSALTGLRDLSIKPLGSQVTEEGVSGMCEPLVHLTRVDLGVTSPAQVDVCKGAVAARWGKRRQT